MAVYETVVVDGDGVPVAGALGYIYVNGVLSTGLTDDLAQPVANPVTTDSLGYVKVNVPFPGYTVKWHWLGRERLIETTPAYTGTDTSTDTTLSANSDTLVPTQKAVKAYADTKAQKSFASPLGGGNQAPVSRDVSDRFKYYASFEDFGIKLFENDGVTVRDNQAALQDAIDKLQPYNGALFVPPIEGSTVVVTGPLTLRSGTVGGKNYSGAGFGLIGTSPGERTSWQNGRYDLGQGLKLKAGSTGALITSPADAGHLTIENMLLSGNNQNQRGIDLVSRGSAYGFGAFLKQVYINGFLKEGLNIGANRGRGATEWLWIEYCGTAGTYAAMVQGSYDWEHTGIGIGVNNGTGIYLGTSSQVRFFGGATWMNEYNMVVDATCEDVDVFGLHFDQAQKHGLVINAATGTATRRGSRRFVGCRWSDNSDSSSGTYSDISLGVNVVDTYFSSPAFCGKGEASPKQKYCVETAAGAVFYADAFPFNSGAQKPYQTAFTNDWTRTRFGGSDAAAWGLGNGGAGMIGYANGNASLEVRDKQVSLGGTYLAEALRAEQNGGSYNRVVVQSTSNAFNFSQIVADSDAVNCDLALAGKGSGVLRFGTYAASALAVTGYVTIKDSAGNTRRLLVG